MKRGRCGSGFILLRDIHRFYAEETVLPVMVGGGACCIARVPFYGLRDVVDVPTVPYEYAVPRDGVCAIIIAIEDQFGQGDGGHAKWRAKFEGRGDS